MREPTTTDGVPSPGASESRRNLVNVQAVPSDLATTRWSRSGTLAAEMPGVVLIQVAGLVPASGPIGPSTTMS